jgi:ABC-2 type transport system permease protein
MSWATVAGKEFRDAIRSRRLWLLTAAFIVVFNLPPVLWAYLEFGPAAPDVTSQTELTSTYVKGMMGINFVFVPLIAIVSGYRMVVGEHETGSLKLLLSLPHSRRDVFLGKILGRTGVVGVAISSAYVLALPLLYGTGQTVDLFLYLLYGALTIFFGLAFFALAGGLSAAVGSELKAGALSFGTYVLFTLFWDPITTLARLLSQSYGLSSRQFLEFWFALKTLSPVEAYRDLTFVMRDQPQSTVVESAYAANGWSGWPPFYLENEWHLAVLIAWGVVPALVGYYLFSRRDL